ncbi:hypothetical protein GCM10011507_10140 [Edaphobacter acidisoli]|uniref:CYTH domain-containing protein n=1 Tax=Edaphobacter acidisoli TaxID=2040573 RepID=A0A916W2B9_9BACT|nr:class IV adenylate cyclase [Edaphobacter acidisoli]GGA60574.1 hypothetical protein GCM10011507_10140 [Edaphobacter acidisoli]
MQAPEIELKFPVADIASLESRLVQLGFHQDTPRTFEYNTLYDTPDRALRATRQILRIRQYGSTATVTHKRMSTEAGVDQTRYKLRIETETTVADADALADIFSQLGYAPVFVYEKYRSEWSQSISTKVTGHLVLDETPIGTFAELEGPPAWIDETLAKLGTNHASCTTDSYGKLFLDWKQRTGSPAENLTFSETAALLQR